MKGLPPRLGVWGGRTWTTAAQRGPGCDLRAALQPPPCQNPKPSLCLSAPSLARRPHTAAPPAAPLAELRAEASCPPAPWGQLLPVLTRRVTSCLASSSWPAPLWLNRQLPPQPDRLTHIFSRVATSSKFVLWVFSLIPGGASGVSLCLRVTLHHSGCLHETPVRLQRGSPSCCVRTNRPRGLSRAERLTSCQPSHVSLCGRSRPLRSRHRKDSPSQAPGAESASVHLTSSL